MLSAVSAVAAAVTGGGATQQEEKKKRRRKKKGGGEQTPAPVPEVREEPREAEHRRVKLTRPGVRLDTGDAMPRTEFDRPDPLAGDHIMDATARLLAPRKSALLREGSASRRSEPRNRRKGCPGGGEGQPRQTGEEKPSRSRQGDGESRKKREERASDKAPAKGRTAHPPRKGRGGSRGPRGPIEPMKSDRSKDSTEQHSLMKPYYLDD